jgi:succinyl-CoA synthetase beta subunit
MPPTPTGLDTAALIAAARRRGDTALSEPEAKALLREIGIPTPVGRSVASAADVADVADAAMAVGFPVAVKAVSRSLTHKTEAGGVIFPVMSPAEATAACGLIVERVAQARPGVALDGFLVEAYQPGRVEWVLSLRIDRQFGPIIMFGLGGIFVELLGQVAFRLVPLDEKDIDILLANRLVARALDGLRGDPSADRDSLKAAIRALSAFGTRRNIAESITEIEINPLIATARGVVALDALVLLRPGS